MSVALDDANGDGLYKTTIQSTPTAITLGIGFYLDHLPAGDDHFIIAKYYTVGGPGGWAIMIHDDGKIGIRNRWDNSEVFGSTTLNTEQWYYVWMRCPGTGTLDSYLYLDGSTSPEVTKGVQIDTTGNADIYLGTYQSAGWELDGSLVGCKVWSVDRAASNANTEKACGNAVDDSNLLAEWKLNTTPWTADTSGNGHTLTVQEGPLSQGIADPGGYSVTCGAGGATLSTIMQYHQMVRNQ